MNGTIEAAQRDTGPKVGAKEKHIGRFRLLSRLGEGGMGSVYAARDTEAPGVKVVALKTTKQQGVEAERLLYDEAEIASRIDHPNVCRVHEVGREGELLYLVLDYCDGASLHDLLQAAAAGRLPTPVAVKIAALVAAGLHAAHELTGEDDTVLEVIHRDVSPQNVLISLDGQVKVTDFGVAKARGQAHRPTETGEVKGKASYMAPEQVRSRDVDRRADVFALGCVLYQCLLGRRPFQGETTVSTLYQILEEEIPTPHEIEPEFPSSLAGPLMKALAKDREQRFSDAQEFQVALETWLVEEGHLVTEAEIASALTEILGRAPHEKKSKVLALARGSRTPVLSVPAVNEELDSTPPATAFQEQAQSPVERRSWPALAAVTVLVAVGGLIWGWRQSQEATTLTSFTKEGAASQTPEVRELEPALQKVPEQVGVPDVSPAASLVSLVVQATPDDAVISIDDVELGVGELEHQLLASEQVHKVQVKKSGYLAVERLVRVESDTRLLFELKKVPSRTPKPAVRLQPRSSGPRPRTVKPKRALDSENPFAQ